MSLRGQPKRYLPIPSRLEARWFVSTPRRSCVFLVLLLKEMHVQDLGSVVLQASKPISAQVYYCTTLNNFFVLFG